MKSRFTEVLELAKRIKKTKQIREKLYKATFEDDRDEMTRLANEWDRLNVTDVDSEMLIFEILFMKKNNEKML